jgi:hypothetical protein
VGALPLTLRAHATLTRVATNKVKLRQNIADGQVVVSYQQCGRLGWKSTKNLAHELFDIAPTSRPDARRRREKSLTEVAGLRIS